MDEVREVVDEHGRCAIPQPGEATRSNFETKVRDFRYKRVLGKSAPYMVKELNSVRFAWSLSDAKWLRQCDEYLLLSRSMAYFLGPVNDGEARTKRSIRLDSKELR
jgi:hypothetical protein